MFWNCWRSNSILWVVNTIRASSFSCCWVYLIVEFEHVDSLKCCFVFVSLHNPLLVLHQKHQFAHFTTTTVLQRYSITKSIFGNIGVQASKIWYTNIATHQLNLSESLILEYGRSEYQTNKCKYYVFWAYNTTEAISFLYTFYGLCCLVNMFPI